LGSRTIEANLLKFVSRVGDARLFRFAAQDAGSIDERLDNRRNLARRVQDAFRLRAAVRAAVKEGRKILFYNISPALFAYGAWKGGEAYITMDWARRLLADKTRPDRDPMTRVHRMVLRACAGLLPMTDAMARCLVEDYGIEAGKIHRVPSIFDVGHFDPGEIRHGKELRVLFVGGDITRKGGDLLHAAFRERLSGKCRLTLVTNADLPPCEGLEIVKGVRYGTPEHLSLMRSHDIFVLPTRQDAGPQVIGEAAAAGLAVFTTKAALGATHVVRDGVTGAIASTPEECIDRLAGILTSPEAVLEMRRRSLDLMRREFSPEIIVEKFAAALA
jgi:glycosyltransferase involved in cell wall biosynthesis